MPLTRVLIVRPFLRVIEFSSDTYEPIDLTSSSQSHRLFTFALSLNNVLYLLFLLRKQSNLLRVTHLVLIS